MPDKITLTDDIITSIEISAAFGELHKLLMAIKTAETQTEAQKACDTIIKETTNKLQKELNI